MAVVIRMKRQGAKKRPFYRVVVADSRSPRDGRYIEQLGYYDPLTNPATFKVDAEKFASWIRKGALPSESVGVMMSKHAPEAMRPAPLPMPERAVAATPRVKKAKAAKAKAAKPAKKKTAKTHKGVEKKAKARARKKTGGAAKPKAAKAKKSKK
jgi:small subunit ribosomal protein S16